VERADPDPGLWATLGCVDREDGQQQPTREGLVRPVRLDPLGLTGPTRGQARGPSWRRSSHGFYLPAGVDSANVDQRILEASVMVPPYGAVTGWAALRWRGATWLSGVDRDGSLLPVPILISSHNVVQQPGIVVCGEGCSPETIEVIDGVPVTDPAWSASFAMRYVERLRDAVVLLEMAAYDDLVSVEEASAVIAGQSSWTGVPMARQALPFVRENAWSPMEVDTGILWELGGGFPRPLQNRPIFDLQGRHIGTPDLLDPVAGVLGEYDGPDHLDKQQRLRDINREARYRDHHLEVVVRMAGDKRDDFLARLAAAYRRAGRRRTPRTWTIEPPPWWTMTTTVAQRRALSPEQRARFLRYRTR
jgi:hypothetical protein